jgi:SAM-dependent methyltransferase
MSNFQKLYGHLMGDINLNLGCGHNHEPGFINIDKSRYVNADLCFDLEEAKIPWNNNVDLILASHVLEHVVNIYPLMGACHKALRPNGKFVAIVPHMGSDMAWEDPTHVRAFSERSWMYFDKRTYEGNHHGKYDAPVDYIFEPESITLVPMNAWKDKPREELERAKSIYRNVISEIHVVMKAVK